MCLTPLSQFCVPAPIVFSDVNYLSTTAPPSAAEWSSFLRPLRGREPEGMWNLLSIVREMYKRNDRNSIPLLEIVTLQCLETAQIMVWWFNTKVAFQQTGQGKHNVNSNSQASQNACASMCDELVTLWKLAALNPCIAPDERETLKQRLIQYHRTVIEKVQSNQGNQASKASHKPGKLTDIEIFSGFKPAIEACDLCWDDYQIPGVTYGHNPAYLCPFTVFKHPAEADSAAGRAGCSQVNSSQAVLRCEYPGVPVRPRSGHEHRPRSQPDAAGRGAATEAARSSLSSEEVASDEGVEEAPSQSEGEGGPEGVLVFGPKYFTSEAAEAVVGGEGEGGVRTAESSPEREVESDWSSGPSEEQRVVEQQVEQQPHLPPTAADPQDYRVYFYDPKVPFSNGANDGSKEEVDIFKNLRQLEDAWEILFMRAEGIHAHGYQSHACDMAVRLALDMLKNPPDLISDAPPLSLKGKKRRVCAASHQITHTASLTLAHCSFLCTVLSETAHNPNHLNLAFKIGMFGLEMARPPASTKPMEVKLAHQESELVTQLKRLVLGPAEVNIVRERAMQLKEGTLKSRGEALLPLMLASFIFDSLVTPQQQSSRESSRHSLHRLAGDELLGFDAAVAAIGLKANVSEADHPLLCEGTRRQRGDLALNLLVTYKDDPERLARIMDKLLDKDIHQMFKTPILPSYYTSRPGQASAGPPPYVPPPAPPAPPAPAIAAAEAGIAGMNLGARPRDRVRRTSREDRADPRGRHEVMLPPGPGSPKPDWDSYKAWEAKFRCANLRVNKPRTPGHHMASIDSSAPETASSDNSPTLVRRFKPPPSDSGSSGNSSDSSGSRRPRVESPPGIAVPGFVPPLGPGPPTPRVEPLLPAQPQQPPTTASNPNMGNMMEMTNLTRTTLPNIKVTRFKGKRTYPSIPNQPSEASAHFMFELAKTVLTKAGGTSTTSLFTQPTANQNPRGPQRALHMCAFQIGLYALGLHNRVSPNWISRTYSSHVSWITGQAMEIGPTAISFLMGTWEGHLTPPEAANIADRASRGRDTAIVTAAAELALSCLNHAHALNPNEIARAILQCKEQSVQMLENACLAVEKAATGGGVYPEVMFEVARHWHDLYKRHAPPGSLPRDDHSMPPPSPTDRMAGLAMAQLPPVTLAQGPGMPGTMPMPGAFNMAGLNPALGIQAFPAVYSLIQGYPGMPSPSLPLHMYVGPPPHHILPIPTTHAGPGGPGIAGQFPGLPHGLPGLQMFPTSEAGPRFNMAGGPLFQLAMPNMVPNAVPNMAPLLPNPPQAHMGGGVVPLLAHPPPSASPLQPPPPPSPGHHPAVNGNQLVCQRYLMSSYRVGMVALETLGRRVSEDRPQTKFTRNPSYFEDVKWLLGVAKKLGLPCLQNFLMCVMATVVSPFVLQELTWDCGCFLAAAPAGTNPGSGSHHCAAVIQQIRTQPYLTSLVQKCYQVRRGLGL